MYIEKYKASYLSFFTDYRRTEVRGCLLVSWRKVTMRFVISYRMIRRFSCSFSFLSYFPISFFFIYIYFYFFVYFYLLLIFILCISLASIFFISSILFISWQQKEHHSTSRIIYCYIGGAAIRTTVSANWFYLTSLCFPSSPVFSVSDAF